MKNTADIDQIIYDIERCTCHVPDACRDCSHSTKPKHFYKVGETLSVVNVFKCMEDLMLEALPYLKKQKEDCDKPIDIQKLIKAWEIFRESNPYEICNGKEFRAIKDPEYCMGQMIEDTLALLKEQEIGHWILLENCSNSGVYCSECHTKVFDNYPFKKKFSYFCPHCGTRMEGEIKRR